MLFKADKSADADFFPHQIPFVATISTNKKRHRVGALFCWRRKWDFRMCDLPDKMSTGHFSPTDKLLAQFSPYSNPIFCFRLVQPTKKRHRVGAF